jgi:glycosyltransferase involved in cell wall biosynthesis
LHNYNFRTPWVLFLDADEVVNEEFKREVESAIQDNTINGYWLTFNSYFQKRLLRHGIPFRKLALFRIGKGEYERIDEERWSNLDMEIHEHPLLSGRVGKINTPITHNDYKGMYHYLARHNEYSTWEAQRFLELQRGRSYNIKQLTPRQRKKYRSLDKWWWAPLYFIVNYVLQLGFLDGRHGFVFSLLKAIYFFEIRCKIEEFKK